MVQNLSHFLLISRNGGNRNSFHLSCVFIKEVNAVKWKLKIFCKIFLSKVFTQLSQLCQVAKWQGGAWPKEGYLRPGIKVHDLKAQVFPLPMLFVLCLFSFSFPCLRPVPKDRSRQCFPWLPALLTPAWHCWGWLPPPSSSPAQPHCCFPLLWGALKEGTLHAEAWQPMGSAQLPGRAGPEAADVQLALLHAELFQGQHGGAFWVGSDTEACRIIRDEQLTLINAFYSRKTSHKPHKSLWRFIAALMTLFNHGDMSESGWIYQRKSLNKA